jgi:hypothetical protein
MDYFSGAIGKPSVKSYIFCPIQDTYGDTCEEIGIDNAGGVSWCFAGPYGTISSMTTPPSSDTEGDREIEDTIRLHLFACYSNAEDRLEYTREEIEDAFATDIGLRAWGTDRVGINPDTRIAQTRMGHAMPSPRELGTVFAYADIFILSRQRPCRAFHHKGDPDGGSNNDATRIHPL